ncbi:MAG: protein BatD, partial [Deltaproteobacteria bacterium]|nr:protein BatD [Deltaproteobacteria bacterium]
SSQVSIVNGRMSSSVEHSYLLFPRKQGVFTVGPFFVRHKGRRVASNSVTLQVRKAAARSDQSRDIFVEAEVDNERPYQYEQLVYRFKFYRRVKVANASLTESPNFEGFLSESLGKEAEYQKVINGQAYVVTEIRQALFPTKTGVYEIGASTLRCDVVVQKRRGRRSFFDDSFFGFSETVPRVFTTKPIT